jgi:hypothetical protein
VNEIETVDNAAVVAPERLSDGWKTTAGDGTAEVVGDLPGECDALSLASGLQRSRLQAELPLDVIDQDPQAGRF